MTVSAHDMMFDLLRSKKQNYSLPREFYNDPEFFQLDMKHVFGKSWVFAGLVCDIPKSGNFFTLSIGDDPLVIVRDDNNEIHAIYNTCRHRGSKVCLEEKGHTTKLVCPYHQWTYNLDGNLLFAGNMGEGFNPADFPLRKANIGIAGGMIFVCLDENPPAFDHFKEAVEPFLRPHALDKAKVAHEITISEKANWKLVIENNRECYHCNGSHPELLNSLLEFDNTDDPRATPEFKALVAKKSSDWDSLGIAHESTPHNLEYRAVRMPLAEGIHSMTMDGSVACQKLMGDLTDPDMGSMRLLHLPNTWNHFMGDHSIVFRVMPVGPQETLVTTKWIVHEDAVEGVDYDLEKMTKVWNATNHQDRELAENNQLGINSKAYQPGPYAESAEFGVINFINWYSAHMLGKLFDPAKLKLAASE